MPLVTFFSVLELPEKNRKGGCKSQPPLVRRGLMNNLVIFSVEICMNLTSLYFTM